MDQKKIGLFLKELRREKEFTQEQLAEQFNVSSRTVSRWETGTNMPDLSVLVELSDFYQVDIKEIIDGERKSETMNEETREVLEEILERIDKEVWETLDDGGDDWFTADKVSQIKEIIESYME